MLGHQVGIPTEAGLPHAMGNAFRNVAALVADIDFTFKEVPVQGGLRVGDEGLKGANI